MVGYLDLQEDTCKLFENIDQIQEEGFIDYFLSRSNKILKELKAKNTYNEKAIDKYKKSKGVVFRKKEKSEKQPRKSAFRINPFILKTQVSKSLRPSTEACENRNFSVRQTLLEIKLD